MDGVVEDINYSYYDMLWLGGDLALSTSLDDQTMMHVDSVFNLGDPNTLWALGNHDYADLDRIQTYTGRPSYYAYQKNGMTFLVLDTQDSLSNIIGPQRELFYRVTDTISESSHLIILHHKLIWMYGNDNLQPMIPYVSNGEFGDCFYCINPNNFYTEIYPVLLEVEERGIEVICIAGDIGFRTNQFEYLTPEGIQFLASGIEAGKPDNMALLFHHNQTWNELTWEYILLSELLVPRDTIPPELLSVSISPDTIKGGESIQVTINAEDPDSGLDQIKLKIVSSSEEQVHTVSTHIGDWISGGSHVYTLDIIMDDTSTTGLWQLSLLSVIDSAGNALNLDNQDSILATFVIHNPVGWDHREEANLSLFPVPSTGIIHILYDPGIKTVEIFDQIGRTVKTESNRTNSIDLTGEPAGIYFIRIRTSDNRTFIRKICLTNRSMY